MKMRRIDVLRYAERGAHEEWKKMLIEYLEERDKPDCDEVRLKALLAKERAGLRQVGMIRKVMEGRGGTDLGIILYYAYLGAYDEWQESMLLFSMYEPYDPFKQKALVKSYACQDAMKEIKEMMDDPDKAEKIFLPVCQEIEEIFTPSE